ncbi:Zinc finger protein [Trichuris trichiura]|uniref:Zinc finger protein n=1 Tax=Trichuris trichiura TaxID=36087 RepID=A0A077Z206_TRITR|nr:Zinc finger protein [Trichuris trichiura]
MIAQRGLPCFSGADYYKPYACQHANCNKRFANKFLLKKHEFIHTGERPHQCPYCCKRFNRKDNLLRHKKTHESSGVLVKRAPARPLELICQTDEMPMRSVAVDSSGFGKLMHHQFSSSAAAVSPEGCFDQDQSTYDEEEDDDEQIEETITVKQDNSSKERNECQETVMAATSGAGLTPSNILLAAVTPKTTSTSQLPIATSFGVTN